LSISGNLNQLQRWTSSHSLASDGMGRHKRSSSEGGRGRRGRGGRGGRGGRRGGRGGNPNPKMTKEELDAQLESYMSNTRTVLDHDLDSYMNSGKL
jgi:hypothetical protein